MPPVIPVRLDCGCLADQQALANRGEPYVEVLVQDPCPLHQDRLWETEWVSEDRIQWREQKMVEQRARWDNQQD
jgi:hypothetical protein